MNGANLILVSILGLRHFTAAAVVTAVTTATLIQHFIVQWSSHCFTLFVREKLFVAVAAAQIFTLLLMYSACDVEKLKRLQKGDVGTWEHINSL